MKQYDLKKSSQAKEPRWKRRAIKARVEARNAVTRGYRPKEVKVANKLLLEIMNNRHMTQIFRNLAVHAESQVFTEEATHAIGVSVLCHAFKTLNQRNHLMAQVRKHPKSFKLPLDVFGTIFEFKHALPRLNTHIRVVSRGGHCTIKFGK